MVKAEKVTLGIDLGGTNIKAGLVSSDAKIIQKVSVESKAAEGPDAVIKQIGKAIKKLSKDGIKISGIGIGAPGVVSVKKGTVENPPNLPGWGKVHLGKILEREFDMPVFVENDANAAAIGEMIYGAGKNFNSFVMITLGTGVGGGIIMKRKIYRGDHGAAGEIGHITIDFNGPRCNCGSYGCIEAYAGNHYLIERVSAELGKHSSSKIFALTDYDLSRLTPKVICDAAELEDEYARSIIIDLGQKVGFALASVCNLLDIGIIIIGGGVAGFGRLLFENIETAMKSRVLVSLKEQVAVIPAALQNEAGILGASALVHYSK